MEADKDDDGEVDKGDSKWDKPKPKQAIHSSKKKDKDSSLKKIEPFDDNLDEFFVWVRATIVNTHWNS